MLRLSKPPRGGASSQDLADIAGAAAQSASAAGVDVNTTALAAAVTSATGVNVSADQVASASQQTGEDYSDDFVEVIIEENPAQDASPS